MNSQKKDNAAERPLTSVMEDYLEAIFDLDKEKRVVRVKDIAKRMNVKMPTVSSMLKTLNQRDLVNYEKYEYVELTKRGTLIGKEIRRRHELLMKFLSEVLKIDPKTADEDACKMEHALSDVTLDSLADFIEFIQSCPRAGDSWLQHFEDFRVEGADPEKCRTNADAFSRNFKKQVATKKNSDQ